MKAHIETIFIVYVQHCVAFYEHQDFNVKTLAGSVNLSQGRGSIYETEGLGSRGADEV